MAEVLLTSEAQRPHFGISNRAPYGPRLVVGGSAASAMQDFTSAQLDLSNPESYRDLTKPIGALNAKRLEYFKERMTGMPPEERFLYGTHYSTPAYVIYWAAKDF